MSRTVELPEAVHAALEEAARAAAATVPAWIAAQLQQSLTANGSKRQSKDDWLDHDFLKTDTVESDELPTLEAVRAAMAKIPGRLADDIRAERDER